MATRAGDSEIQRDWGMSDCVYVLEVGTGGAREGGAEHEILKSRDRGDHTTHVARARTQDE